MIVSFIPFCPVVVGCYLLHVVLQQETVLGQRHENQKTAAFNLGVAEAVKQKQLTRDTGFYVSQDTHSQAN